MRGPRRGDFDFGWKHNPRAYTPGRCVQIVLKQYEGDPLLTLAAAVVWIGIVEQDQAFFETEWGHLLCAALGLDAAGVVELMEGRGDSAGLILQDECALDRLRGQRWHSVDNAAQIG